MEIEKGENGGVELTRGNLNLNSQTSQQREPKLKWWVVIRGSKRRELEFAHGPYCKND